MFCSIIDNSSQLTDWMKQHAGLYELVQQFRDIHGRYGYRFFIVGGFVRDWMLGQHALDLDIAVEGDIQVVMREIAKCCELEYVYYERFKTATFTLAEGEIDLVTCRSESYVYDGALPTVKTGTVEDDLERRDFTINSLAIDLTEEPWKVCGLENSIVDLDNQIVRVLHDRSFLEDPTRIFRACRYKQRLGFTFDQKTHRLIEEAVDEGAIQTISADRVLAEISRILIEAKAIDILEELKSFGIDRWILPNMALPAGVRTAFKNIDSLELTFIEDTESFDPVELRLLALLYFNADRAHRFVERFRLSRRFSNMIEDMRRLVKQFSEEGSSIKNAQIHSLLKGVPDEVLFVSYLCTNRMLVKNIIERYYIQLKDQKNLITGHDLIEMGLPMGPQMKEILQDVFAGLLNGEIGNRTEAMRFAKKLIAHKERTEGKGNVNGI